MKNIFYVLLSVMVCASCTDDFLELYPETSLSEGKFYKSQDEFIQLANGCYVPLRDYEKTFHWLLAEMISDNTSYQFNNTTGSASTGREAIDMFLPASNYTTYSDFWELSYSGITRCNKLLFEINNTELTWDEVSYKERSTGEALFLRALYYFNLVRQFGDLPIVTEPIIPQEETVNIKRSAPDKVYAQIISDLVDAVAHFSNAQEVEENGRANLSAANALLGKVYLTTHKFTEASTVLKRVIDSGKYNLLTNYADLYNPANKDYNETIFSVQYSENSAALSNKFIFWFAPHTSRGEVTLRPNINIAGSGGYNQPTEDLINAFEPNDKRKNVSIGFWTGKDWDGVVRTLPYCAKFKPPISAPDNRSGDNFPIIRYSDVLLMYAEALNEQGLTGAAIPYVYQVRQRAGLTNDLVDFNKAGLSELIAKERQVEFCFENQRWYDLKRTGKAIETMTSHGIREKAAKPWLYPDSFDVIEYKLINPIPNNEVLNNKIEQNPGY
ncbi:RagB/SusD family nutrient uptake outer membrane protein [Arenibacter sp. F26102]|uniref:RagB/SusD family nutrient uptake outer membrane protein n=1 Tax=Arenibacter sp. F26102 TaxID=2926416 RepID=UPI001FF5C99F|nr:RagB/SusD family nutrient uptake outer membrane protein [Arenibacter sp. F26102]MCK0148279.1 RagB/SusD family nutrient uptake outer membrane protein [Arenibacter sp. F26102]